MIVTASDAGFTGSIPELYERHLVPMIFDPFAADLARRAQALAPGNLLEVAAGTGAVTRHLARLLPADCAIVATDLNDAMIGQAARAGTSRPVEWRVADAMALPFEDASFDLVTCQFGVMFFPDRAKGYAEARRVLRPGGHFLFNTWGPMEANALAQTVQQALAALYPQDPPRFMARVPHGYNDADRIRQDLAAGGFGSPAAIETLDLLARAPHARDVAIAFCQGTPVRSEIEARDPEGLPAATDAAHRALLARFGAGPVQAPVQAVVVAVRK